MSNANKVEDYGYHVVNIRDDKYTIFMDWAQSHPIYKNYKRYSLISQAMEYFMEAHKTEVKK